MPPCGRLFLGAVLSLAAAFALASPAAAADHVIITTDAGELVFRLTPETAPRAVRRFKTLIRRRTYDGTEIYRLVAGYFAQGGIGYEAAMTKPRIGRERRRVARNIRGALAFARQDLADPGSATTEFYWCVTDLPVLDKAGFVTIGNLVAGFDTLDRIDRSPTLEAYRYWNDRGWQAAPKADTTAIPWHRPARKIAILSIRLSREPIWPDPRSAATAPE